MNNSHPQHYLLLFAIFIMAAITPAVSAAQSQQSSIGEEYLVRQAEDEDLFITINAFEAEFKSKISGQAGEVLLLSGVPGSRIIPLFQYIRAPENDRQLAIEVTSDLHTGRSQFGLELTRITVWDDRSSSLSRAYSLLSFGMQASSGAGDANWTVKIDSLINAGRIFQQFGMREMRLWANYLAAHLIQLHLHDHSIVYTMTREILSDLKGSRLPKIELATLQLHGAALIGLKRSGSLSASAKNPDPVQSVLLRTASLAQAMGFRFEQASALYASGIEFVTESAYTKALEQFQLAVQIADSVGDAEFATGIRESIVQIHTVQGNSPATGEVLREIETQLTDEGADDELALNLLAQGRLLIRSYRFYEAADVLSQALNYENNSAIRRQINFELAMIFYETGRLDESLAYFSLAEIKPGTGQPMRANSLIDVARGLGVIANIYRTLGEYAQMRKARSSQARYKPEAARFLYDQGMDELTQAGKNTRKAQSFFRQSQVAAAGSKHLDLQNLALLQACALDNTDGNFCSKARASYGRLLAGGVPRLSAEAMFLWAKILDLAGQRTAAITVMDKLLGEVHFIRHSLPGVLGAWYSERHEQLFEDYLDLQLAVSGQRGRADGSASLLALSKIRFIGKYSDLISVSGESPEDTEQLRLKMAGRANIAPGTVATGLNDSINQDLARLRQPFQEKFAFLSKSGLQRYLRNLAHDERLLTYHISPTTAQVWVGQKGKVQTRAISNPAYIFAALQEARQGLADVGISSFNNKMDALGERLLGPIADLLAETVYWIPSGPLLGFPLDALRFQGKYLAESHQLINLTSFPANTSAGPGLYVESMERVFVAGHPQDYSSDYATRLETSTEIRAIADIFVGPGLRIVQGVALLPDEFQDDRFQQADMLHLSMPGVIDLRFPEQSRLKLSGAENSLGRVFFTGRDIHPQQLLANLVFLSATRMEQNQISGFSSQPGLISDFLGAGAQAVIANTWATSGETVEGFITNFYRKLETSKDIAGSFSKAKRDYIKSNRNTGLYDWAGYQLFID